MPALSFHPFAAICRVHPLHVWVWWGLLLLWLAPRGVQAQRLDPSKALSQYNLTIYRKEQGLPQSTVHAIVQSHEGYLYAATYKGLARFDGARFKVFDRNTVPAFKLNGLFALLEDRDSTLWIGTNGGGLIRYKAGGFTTFTTADGLANNIVTSLYEDQSGTLWVGTRTGLSKKTGEDTFAPVDTSAQLGRESVLSMVEVRPGVLWLGTHGGLYQLVNGVSKAVPLPAPLKPRGDFFSLLRSTTGEVWVCTGRGLLRYTDGKFREYTTADGLSDNAARVVYEDRGGTLWVGTLNGGLNRLEGERFTYLDAAKGVSDEQVIAVCEDREGNLWFGTKRGGLYRLSEGKFLNYGLAEGLPDENINGIVEGPDGAVWIGTSNDGLVRYKDGAFRRWGTQQGLGSVFARALHFVSEEELWVGTYGAGIARLRGERIVGSVTTRDGLPDDNVRVIVGTLEKGLWIGTRNGLSYYANGRFRNYSTQNGLGTNSILSLAEDPDGSLWVGTDGGGLHRIKDGAVRRFTEADGLLSGVVMNLYYDPRDQCLWIGTNNGLCKYQDGAFFSYSSLDGVFPSVAFQILEDDEHNLWLGSNDGIFRVSKKELHAMAKGTLKQLSGEQFTELDGMRSAECTPNCYPNGMVGSDGRLWFPTNGGVSVIDTRRVPRNSHPPLFHIDQVWADGQTYPLTGRVRLPPGIGKLEVEFSAITFVATGKTHVEYMLEGFDTQWQVAGQQRMAAYTNLWPGTYTFKVRGANNDGVRNEAGALVVLTLQPYVYQTVWFWLFIGVVVSTGLFLGYRANLRRLQRRNEELEVKVLERTHAIEQQSEALRQRTETITQLGLAGQEITGKLSQSEVFHLLHRHLVKLLDFDYFGINLYDSERRTIVFAFSLEGNRRLPVEQYPLDDPRSLSARCVRDRMPLLVQDIRNERDRLLATGELLQRTEKLMRARIYLPLQVEDRILGCLTVQHSQPGSFTRGDLELLQTLAAYAAIALDNAHAYQKITLAGSEIARQNHLLEQRNQELAQAMDQLKAAQDRLITTEKMAALGGLVANIAHEINTPISAVATSARNTQRFLPTLIYDLPRHLPELAPAEVEAFYSLVLVASEAVPYGSTRQEREGRRELRECLLLFLPTGQAEEFSLKLVQMGFRGDCQPYKELLARADAAELLNLATNLVHLSRNNELIIEAIARTSKIVLALKAYTRLSEDSNRQAVRLPQSIDVVLERLHDPVAHAGIVVDRRYAYDAPLLLVPEEVELVWANLLHNAFKAVAPTGTVTVEVAPYRPSSTLNGTTASPEVCVSISDTGPGIPREVLPRIFEPFFTTRPRGEGAGLGLDIARKIVEKHHGRIEVESSTGGTTFRVILPQHA